MLEVKPKRTHVKSSFSEIECRQILFFNLVEKSNKSVLQTIHNVIGKVYHEHGNIYNSNVSIY